MPELLLSILWTLGFYQHYWGVGEREEGKERWLGSQGPRSLTGHR